MPNDVDEGALLGDLEFENHLQPVLLVQVRSQKQWGSAFDLGEGKQ